MLVVDLDNMSFTSRLAFYALCEVCRLLRQLLNEEQQSHVDLDLEVGVRQRRPKQEEGKSPTTEKQVAEDVGSLPPPDVTVAQSDRMLPDLIPLCCLQETSQCKSETWRCLGRQLCQVASAFEVFHGSSFARNIVYGRRLAAKDIFSWKGVLLSGVWLLIMNTHR